MGALWVPGAVFPVARIVVGPGRGEGRWIAGAGRVDVQSVLPGGDAGEGTTRAGLLWPEQAPTVAAAARAGDQILSIAPKAAGNVT